MLFFHSRRRLGEREVCSFAVLARWLGGGRSEERGERRGCFIFEAWLSSDGSSLKARSGHAATVKIHWEVEGEAQGMGGLIW